MKELNGYCFKDVYDYYAYVSDTYMTAPRFDDLREVNKAKFIAEFEALPDCKKKRKDLR